MGAGDVNGSLQITHTAGHEGDGRQCHLLPATQGQSSLDTVVHLL
jgi:hypothetical protein